jgi:hypothetical protein
MERAIPAPVGSIAATMPKPFPCKYIIDITLKIYIRLLSEK